MTPRVGRPRKYGTDKQANRARQNLTVYLGSGDLREERYQRLQFVADQLAEGNVSKMIQMIADGELSVGPAS